MRIAEQDDTLRYAGAYDLLYASTNLLWPSKPGRMVAAAANIHSPGRALDLGCGDGKNLVFLERSGWCVDGVDVSELAIQALERRFESGEIAPRGEITHGDAVATPIKKSFYDLVVCYGLYHCLNDEELMDVHGKVLEGVRPGGLFAFAVFNDQLPIPEEHHTGTLYLRSIAAVFSMCAGWEVVSAEYGRITEAHPPLVPTHCHALTGGLLRKPSAN